MFEKSFLFFFAGLACDILGEVTLDEDLSKPSVRFPPFCLILIWPTHTNIITGV